MPRPLPTPAPEPSVPDDAALMAGVVAGEHTAFAQLVHRHSERFYRIAYRFSSQRSEAEDAVQEACLKLWEKPQMWQPGKEARFTTWFYRVVVNICLDRQKKKRPLPLSDEMQIEDTRAGQEAQLLQARRQHMLESQIAGLPERQRTALNLCFYEELSNQEAADVMGLHLKALQSLLVRAKLTLKERMKDWMEH